jgi:hemerythrin
MALIQWTDALSVKIGTIDEQHKKLILLINELDVAMRAGKGKDILGKILNELVAYVGTHFGTEEKLFAQHAYPDTAVHKMEHGDFVRKVGEFKKGFESGKLGLTIELMNFLSDWLRKHIMGTDQKYGPFLVEKGVK